jgi:hypothetical protein
MDHATDISRQLVGVRNGMSRYRAIYRRLWKSSLLVLGFLSLLPAMAGAAFTDNADGTVTDSTTGLTWKHCSEGQTWAGSSCTGPLTYFTGVQPTP